MLNPQRTNPSHVDAFIERYERLRAWALQLTERDRERADDLLHDAFIQFALSRPEFASIDDLDSYLYVCLRNLHLSQMRRATRTTTRELSIIEYDSAELGLWVIDPRDQIKTQDELRTVCHYACGRRRTSKAGSVLILRFFHGYYPEEVAAVLRITRPAVKDRLRLVRAEAKLYLSDSDRLNILHDKRTEERPRVEVGRMSDDLLKELRQAIFNSCEGPCFSGKQLKEFYDTDRDRSLSIEAVAHIVTCAKCLDEVNRILGLPLLSERYASDLTGKDTRKKGGPTGGSGKGGGGLKECLNSYLRRAQQVYRHEPQELCVSVNGYLQSTQKISSSLNELTLIVDTAEQIGFVEVFSEQGVRLLLLNVEPLPVGAVRQDTRVELSEGRTLDASLSFGGAWPRLHITYQDPLAQDLPELASEDLGISPTYTPKIPGTEEITDNSVLDDKSIAIGPRSGFLLPASEWSKRMLETGFWLRPATITIVFAALLISAMVLLLMSKPSSQLSALDVLQRAIRAEELALARPHTVVHRSFQLEERRGSIEGEILTSQRVELWQSAAKGIAARRLYDSNGRLIAGEWINKDDVATIYHHGIKPQVRPSSQLESRVDRDVVWQLSPSAKDFATIVGEPQAVALEERGNHYVLMFVRKSPSADHKLVKATLVIGRDDLHAIEQTLVVQQNAEIRFYRITETSFERRPMNAVAPSVFEPEPELLGEVERIKGDETKGAHITLPLAPPILATPELEIEVLRLLNGAGGDLSDQVSVTRTTDGQLRIEGIVETARRKADIMHALSSIRSHPAITIRLDTIAEAEQRAAARRIPRTIESQQVQIARTSLPIEPELRRYFASRGVSPALFDQETAELAGRVLRRSLQARLYARTLKQMMNRFSPDDLQALTPEARQKLMGLIREQTASLSRELSALSNELQAIMPGSGVHSGWEQVDIQNDAALMRAVKRLGELVAHMDEGVRASFSISSERISAAPVKDAQFWRSLKSAESLAQKISHQ